MSSDFQVVFNRIERYRDEMVEFLKDIIRIPAICPDFGGKGELQKAQKIRKVVEGWGFDEILEINAEDKRADGGVRPNLAFLYGKEEKRVWLISHLDVVQPGDLSKWTVTKPFDPIVKDGKVYGRGAEDNGQALVSSLFAAKALIEGGENLKRSLGILLVSDEECGSKYGLEHVVSSTPELIKSKDLVVVPDGGMKDGLFIEVAEKSILWLKIVVEGKQVHASMPHKGFNAHRVGVQLSSNLDRILKNKYYSQDPLFDPPESTFELTMGHSSSDSPNIIPSRYEFVLDSRILPSYRVDEILDTVRSVINYIKEISEQEIDGEKYPKISMEVIQRSDAPDPTPSNSEVVEILKKSIITVKGAEPRVGGIGGGTVAAILRKRGIPATVWSTIDETAHQPDEYAVIDNMVADAKVFSLLPII
jgi:succinyl-diaminopimelate desuccinylase